MEQENYEHSKTIKSLIEELFGDLRTFDRILSNTLRNWGGQGAVIPIEALSGNPSWLFDDLPSFSGYCKLIRSRQNGIQSCWQCDLEACRQAAKEKCPVEYICDNGLLDIAVPILVENQSIGTIVYGQRRIKDDVGFENEAIKKIEATAKALGLDVNILIDEWTKVPVVSNEEIEQSKSDVSTIAQFVSSIVSERRVLRIQNKRALQIENILDKLSLSNLSSSNPKNPVDDFWNILDSAIAEISTTINATHCTILTNAFADQRNGTFLLQSEFPNNANKGKQVKISDAIKSRLRKDRIFISSMSNLMTEWKTHPPFEFVDNANCANAEVSCIPISVEPDIKMIIMFLGECATDGKDLISEWLSFEQQEDIFETIKSRIKSEFSAAMLLNERIIQERDRIQYIQDVTHQLVGPLSGIRAHCDNLLHGRVTVEKGKTILETLVEQSGLLQRYAINFGHAARENGDNIFHSEDWRFEILRAKDVKDMLIKCVKSFQGQAKEKGLKGPSVDEVSFRNLSSIMAIPDLLEILFLNIIDNAVKYSMESSPINIAARSEKDYLTIEFINHGIALHETDINRIFLRHERSLEAAEFSPGGTGIGLFICDQICKLHGATITALPSKRSVYGNEVKFIVRLPLLNKASIQTKDVEA